MAEASARSKPRAREDWIVAAIDLLVRDGADAIRIDRLADELAVTKGSFYHHFTNRDDLVDGIASYWAKTQTEHVLALLGDVSDAPLGKLKQLIKLFTDLDIGTRDHAMRSFGTREPRIARAVDEADQKVLATLEKILRGLGASTTDARLFARILTFSTIGFYTAPNLVPQSESRVVGKRLLELMMESLRER